jgi:precorrin-3B synthase
MTTIARKGWCPTLFAPMPSGDGLLVRVRPPGGVLGAAAARRLATAAAGHGSGAIDLTNRASLQLRGLRADRVAPFAAEMVAAGLAHPDAEAERRRAVIAPPLAGDDCSAHHRATAVVASLEAMLLRNAPLSALPGKFGVLVDAGGVLPTASAPADIRVLLDQHPGERALIVLDGSPRAAISGPCEAADAVRRLALAFIDLAAQCDNPPRRMRALVDSGGADAVFAAAGLLATTAAPQPPPPNPIGWLPYPGGRCGAFGVGLPFGATDAATLAALADIAERFGDGTLRLTPWRALVLPGVTAPDALRDALAASDVIVAGNDARARMSVCPGAPACASASVPTRADATAIAALRVPGNIHVSGCAKGCAHPTTADLTLVGEAGCYALVRHGRAGDAPTHGGLSLANVVRLLKEDAA